MKVNFNVILIMVALTLFLAIVISEPGWLSDSNTFLKSFIGEPLLSALGVMV